MDLIYRSVISYINVAAYTIFTNTINASYERHTAIKERIEQKVEGGLSAPRELSRAQARQAEAYAKLITVRQNLSKAISEYRIYFPVNPLPEKLPPEILELQFRTTDTSRNLMMQNNPSVLRAISALEASVFNAKKVKGESLPRLDLEIRGSQYNLSEQSDEYDVYSGLNLSYDLYTGGSIRMRKWPMDCDRVVIAAGRSGRVPSFFDSAIGGVGGSPVSPLGAGFSKVKESEPVLIDIVHVHRGYVSDCTRMFYSGHLGEEWRNRLDDMIEIGTKVRGSLARGEACSSAWKEGRGVAEEMGHGGNLMGISPEQASFLGHSVGLELDETPVVADGFDRPLELGGTMAIEPKVIYEEGAIGIEDTWSRTSEGMECLTSGDRLPSLIQW